MPYGAPSTSMARSWLVDSRSIAKKVKNASLSSTSQIKDYGAHRECPNCHHCIDNSDVFPEWPGMPAGVKFDPSDAQLLEHLAAKCGVGNSKPHMLIDEFIPTLEVNEGICYTHPENLPGAKKDGNSVHFFHRTMNAYATGQRKRRKIDNQHSLIREDVRWHKTGKTKPVTVDGLQKGWQKIMVLYKSSKKGSKPVKSNWVMHQYHLGVDKDERDGEYVVSKIFYQLPKDNEEDDKNYEHNNGKMCVDDPDVKTLRTSPRTPKANPPNPPRAKKSVLIDSIAEDDIIQSPALVGGGMETTETNQLEDDKLYAEWLAGESQSLEDDASLCEIDESLLCKEIIGSCSQRHDKGSYDIPQSSLAQKMGEVTTNNNIPCGISELEKLEFDTPPDFLHPELPFGSQECIFDWLDRL